jgi:FMN reductase
VLVKQNRPLIVGIGGTLRDSSTSERALRLALRFAEAAGCATEIFAGQAINLPLYDPGSRHRSAEAEAMVAGLRHANGVIVSSPGYHGTVSGLVKNALDYIEEMRTDERAYLSERSLGIIVCADGIQAMGSTMNTLRSIGHALRAWPTPFAVAINATSRPFAPDGSCGSAEVEQSLKLLAAQVVEFAQMRIAADQNETAAASREAALLAAAELSQAAAEWGEIGGMHFNPRRPAGSETH